MWHIHKIDPFQLIAGLKYVAVVGAGGKTSLIEFLAGKAADSGKKTVITTTTKMYAKEPYMLFEQIAAEAMITDNPIQVGNKVENGKITALSPHMILSLGNSFDLVLIEADGAKSRPLKYPADHEPVIPDFCEMICVIAGLDALSGKIKDGVFRWDLFCKDQNISEHDIVTPRRFVDFFTNKILMKGTANTPFLIVLNKYDALKERHRCVPIAKEILETCPGQRIIVSSIKQRLFYCLQYSFPE